MSLEIFSRLFGRITLDFLSFHVSIVICIFMIDLYYTTNSLVRNRNFLPSLPGFLPD